MANPVPLLLSTVDRVLIAGYIGGLIALGMLASRRRFAPVDFFLASRASRWPTIGLAMLGANISSTALVGVAGGAYAFGLSVYDYEWPAAVILVFFCFALLPSVIHSGIFTMPEFLERRYDLRTRRMFALLTLFLIVVVDCAGVLYSGSLVCRMLFPAQPLGLIVTLLAVAAALYTAAGGLRAVMLTEAVQGLVLMAGAVMISYGSLERAGGWHAVMRDTGPAALSLIRPIGDPSIPWPGLLTGIPLLGFYYWCTNQSVVQDLLSAKNIDHARWGALFAGLLKLPMLFLIVMPGICARLLFPHLAQPDLVYPTLILDVLPAGVTGLVMAAFAAATMVSMASLLNSASTLVTLDVIKPWKLKLALSNDGTVRMGRLATAVLLIFAVAWAPQLDRFPSLWQYLQGVLAYVVPPVVTIFLVGLVWRGATADGAAATLAGGSVCGLLLFVANGVMGWTHWHFLYAAPFLTVVDTLILVTVSLRGGSVHAGDSSLAWRAIAAAPTATPAPALTLGAPGEPSSLTGTPIWRDYRYLAAALLALTAAIVIAFR